MKKFLKAITALMLMVAVVCATGCTKDPDNGGNNNGNNTENGGGNGNGGSNGGGNGSGDNSEDDSTPIPPTDEGMYLGIIGFNDTLYPMGIRLLNSDTKQSFTSFIDRLTQKDLTALFYADYTGLRNLQSYPEPPALTQVALVTFTDGLDNISTSNDIMDPEGYGTVADYRAGLQYKIMSEQVYGHSVSAYTIDLRGNDAQTNLPEFQTNINMLASSPSNVFEVMDMDQALEKFEEIANTLYSQSTSVNLKLRLPGGLDDGLTVRFTFDNTTDGNSSKYIEATYRRTPNNGRRLENINYRGFTEGASSVDSESQSETGIFHWFEFVNLTKPSYPNPVPISQNDINQLKLWKKQGASWQLDSEYPVSSSTKITEDRSSALIMLVLDCTTSLGETYFREMKNAAVRFVETLVSSNNGGGNNGGGNNGGNDTPEGFINGKFSVSASQQVYFSQGNLQYKPSTNKWQFAEHQYDYIGNANSSIDQYYNGWIDLFGWGTSGFLHGATCYQPYSTSQSYSDYYAYGSSTSSLYDQNGLADWGANAISNGGNQTRIWRTLTKEEWVYLLQNRNTSSGLRYAKAKVTGKNGLILFPDNWNGTTTINPNGSYNDNVISSSTWNTLQSEGVVFLPAAGCREGTTVSGVDEKGYYWSSSCNGASQAGMLYFNSTSLTPNHNDSKHYGQSVRLVRDVE